MPREAFSEDCLHLSVWTPAHISASGQLLPVWFWVHGGSFHSGSSNESRLDGRWNAMRSEIIVVVPNYRLNVFGFLGSSALRSRDISSLAGRGGTGNYGILDQRAALRWVRANIAQFGGDASRVMLGGQSAGGASVFHHLVRPASWGLFSRALAMSGAYTLVLPQPEAADYELTFEIVVNVTHCNRFAGDAVGSRKAGGTEGSVGGLRGAAVVACLEHLSPDELLHAWRALRYDPSVRFEPIVDGSDLKEQVAVRMRRGEVAPGVPLVAGATSEDLDYPLWPAPSVTLGCDDAPSSCNRSHFASFVHDLKPTMGWSDADAAHIVAAYDERAANGTLRKADATSGTTGVANAINWHGDGASSGTRDHRPELADHHVGALPAGGNFSYYYWASRRLGSDYTMVCPARRVAHWLGDAHGGRQRTWLYLFAHPPDGSSGKVPAAAHHSSELPFAFRVEHSGEWGQGGALHRFNVSRERPLADAMASALVTFAATGAPPSSWPPYHHSAEQSWMVFGLPTGRALRGSVFNGLKRTECGHWDATALKLDSKSDPRFVDSSSRPIAALHEVIVSAMATLLWPATKAIRASAVAKTA
jgi:carboxylesterase type B